MTPPEQSGAMVFGFDREDIRPGTSCRAVIVQLVPATLEWQQVEVGLTLPCYEGNRVVAHGRVLWREAIETITDEHRHRWLVWLAETTDEDGAS